MPKVTIDGQSYFIRIGAKLDIEFEGGGVKKKYLLTAKESGIILTKKEIDEVDTIFRERQTKDSSLRRAS